MTSPEPTTPEPKKTRTATLRAKKTTPIEPVTTSNISASHWSKKWLPTLLIISVALNIILLASRGDTSDMGNVKKYTNHTEHDPKAMTLTDMSQMLYGKEGDDLNKSFLEGMIPHHEAAIEMARALERSNKPELVNLGRNIVTVQSVEIEQMKKWLREWNYEDTDVPETQPTEVLY